MGCFEVGEQANCFQYRCIEVLRLIDNNYQTVSGPCLLQQMIVELLVHPNEILMVCFVTQFSNQQPHEFPWCALCLKQEGRPCRTAKFFQQMEQQRGLAHPRLSDQRKESASGLYAVGQRS